MSHTIGPWKVEQFPYGNKTLSIVGSDNIAVCRLSPQNKAEANARLIAAAPTMYAYIEKMANAGYGEAQEIRDAIQKAGEA